MLHPHESREEMLERMDREHARFLKQLRRERWSMSIMLIAWALYLCILPFTSSPEQIFLLLSIFLVFVAQFIFVMAMD